MSPPPPVVEAKRPYTPKHLAEKILTSRSALEGERRVVTVLFADYAGFTSIAEKLDPEDVHRIMEGCFERIAAEIRRFEGTINQYRGDGVMALFGAPIAHEDGPRRAAHAARGIQRSLAEYGDELERSYGIRLRMRVGLTTGTVVVGRIGDDLRMDYTGIGARPDLWRCLAALGRIRLQRGDETGAEEAYRRAAQVIESIAAGLGQLSLRHSFLSAEPVGEVYRALGSALPSPRIAG